ncbi:MAG TPA: MOSC N-terminal beta barrel domain-containing protein [Gaiellaceae bacterium]|nr:MOSC N-terminal beta barrel domain-containing protein [Gaiellaceae bacterium]
MKVVWIAVAPIKGMALELVEEAQLTEAGIAGDRRFFLVDENDRLVNAKGLGVLQQIRPVYDDATRTLSLHMPNGAVIDGVVETNGEVTANFWGDPKQTRVVVGPWSDAISDLAAKNLRLVEPADTAADRGRSGATTLLSTGSLRALAQELGVDEVDHRRFRMHFGIDGVDAHEEDGWIGKRVAIGEAVVIPQGNVGRCAVTTQNPESGRPDLDTLKALARYRGQMKTTEPLPFGVYAAVAQVGWVKLGDAVAVL